MKSTPSYFLLLSAQLVLHADISYALPHLESFDKQVSRALLTSSGEDGAADQSWQKRAPPESAGATQSRPSSQSPPAEGEAKLSPTSAKYERFYQQSERRQIKANKPISQAEYHAKALALNAKRVGKEIFHGPVRGVLEMPLSGVVGAGCHTIVACKYTRGGRLHKAGSHIVYAAGKGILGVIVTPAYLGIAGVVNAVPPAGRAAKHFVGMTAHGAIQGFNNYVRGKESEKNVRRQDKLKEAKVRPNILKKNTTVAGHLLRSSEWNGPDEDGRPLSYGREYDRD